MEVLVIEDDLFKYSKIEDLVKEVFSDVNIIRFDNVHDSIIYFKTAFPDKIILDMSLPSHSAKVGEGSPLSMPTGGIEVILELRSIGKLDIPIIVLTQYPEIEIESEYYSISDSERKIKTLFGMSDLSVVLYENDSTEWRNITAQFLRI